MLPPNAPKPEIHQRNVFKVLVSFKDELRVQDQNVDISMLKDMTKEFMSNPANNGKMSEKTMKEVTLLGQIPVSKGVVSLKNDRGTSYEMYIKVQNELTAAFHELRDEMAKEYFGVKFDDLKGDQQKAVQEAIPVSISEAEPTAVNVGGAR